MLLVLGAVNHPYPPILNFALVLLGGVNPPQRISGAPPVQPTFPNVSKAGAA